MRTNVLFFFFVCLSVTDLFAQADSISLPKHKVAYYNNFLPGGLLGEKGKGVSLTFSTTHGIRYKRWAVGLGISYDTYNHWNTLPLYGSIAVDVARIGVSAFFVQVNAGHTLTAWIPGRDENQPDIDADGGMMASYMIGYSIKANQCRLYFSAGYKFQRINYSTRYSYPRSRFSVQEDKDRIAVQFGFGWH